MTRRRRPTFIAGAILAGSALFLLGSQQVDPDLFWHLRVAELLRASGPRPFVDTFSYNSSPTPWLPYSWLAELGMRAALTHLGTSALLLVPLVSYILTLWLLALTVTSAEAAGGRAALTLVLAAPVLLPFMALRPAALTFPLCAFAASAVFAPTTGKLSWRAAATLPTTILLANLHLYFLFPPLLLAGRAAGDWLATLAGRRDRHSEATKYAALAFAALALGLILNPFGPDLLRVAARYTFEDVMARSDLILEMQPFYRLGPVVVIGSLSLLLWALIGMYRAERRSAARDLPMLALAVALLAAKGRYAPLAVLVLAPLAARYGPWPTFSRPWRNRLRAVARGGVLGLLLTAGVQLPRAIPRGDLDRYLENRSDYPVAAAQFVRDSLNIQGGRLINEMGWGGYLIYALWPRYRVMIDGRTQVYPEAVWRAIYVNSDRSSKAAFFRTTAANAAVLARGSSWQAILERDLRWRRVYGDSIATVWIPPDGRVVTAR